MSVKYSIFLLLITRMSGCSFPFSENNKTYKMRIIKSIEILSQNIEESEPKAKEVKFSFQEFDRLGNMTAEMKYDLNGVQIFHSKREFNNKRKIKVEKLVSSQNEIIETYIYSYLYDSDGRELEINVKSKDSIQKSIFEYNDEGQNSERIYLNDIHTKTNLFNEQELLSIRINEKMKVEEFFTYDEEGNLTEIKQQHGEGHASLKYSNEYDSSNNLIQVKMNGRLEVKIKYNKEGSVSQKKYFEITGKERQILNYRYTYFD